MRGKLARILLLALLLAGTGAYLAGARAPLLPWSVWIPAAAGFNLAAWQGLMRPAVFAWLCIWFYAWLGNLIPQSRAGPAMAPGHVERTEEAFISAGEAIYQGKGKCAACHQLAEGAGQPRCPDLKDIGSTAAGRREGVSAKQYLVESLYLPSAYLVEGYGPTMPAVWKPPIALAPPEIEMVVAYLLSLGGEVDLSPVIPPVDVPAPQAGPAKAARGDPVSGKQLFEETFECSECHRVAGRGGGDGEILGPDLTEIGALNTIEYLEESILDPGAKIVAGFASTNITLANGGLLSGTVLKNGRDSVLLRIDKAVGAGSKNVIRVIAKTDIAIDTIADAENLAERGFFWVQGVLNDGSRFRGDLVDETRSAVTIRTREGKVTVDKSRIFGLQGREMLLFSKMPEFDQVITLKEFHDLLAYLAGLDGRQAETAKRGTGGP